MPGAKFNLMDLNEDCQMTIFENLSVFDLISLAQVNNRLDSAAEAVIKQKLKQKQLSLHGPYATNEQNSYNGINDEFSDRIDIGFMPIILQFLKRFGHLVYDMQIYLRDTSTKFEAQQLYQHINSYCSSTLIKLYIRNLKDDSIFDEFKSSFKNTEEIKLWGEFDHLNNLNFTKVFPVTVKLQLSTQIFNHVQLIEHMPHLKHYTFVNWYEQATDSIKQFIRNNRQLESLEMTGISPKLLQFIADQLLHLKNLTLSSYDNVNYDLNIHFEHVHRFKVTTYPLPKNISFGQVLEEFECVVFHDYSDRLVQLIHSHQNTLKILRLMINVENFDILQFVDMNLKEIELNRSKESEINSVIKLIERSKCLERFDLKINSMDYSEKKNFFNFAFGLLQNKLANDWAIHKTDGFHIVLNRL